MLPNNTIDGLMYARNRKQNKQEYLSLLEDIESNTEWNVTYDTIEIGTLGQFTKDSTNGLQSILPSTLNSKLASKPLKQMIFC